VNRKSTLPSEKPMLPEVGLALIYVPRVPVRNSENHRVCRSQPADFEQVPVCQETAVSPAEIVRNSLTKTASSTLFFSVNFNAFSPNRNRSDSSTCEDDIHVAREKTPWHSWHVNQAYPTRGSRRRADRYAYQRHEEEGIDAPAATSPGSVGCPGPMEHGVQILPDHCQDQNSRHS
jgi:hypothetical protein